MPALQEQYDDKSAPTFRLDVRVHDLLTKAPAPRPTLLPSTEKFPEPVFPQYPEVLAQDDNYEETWPSPGPANVTGLRHMC